MNLRTHPAIEHAALPGGGTVTVWVGVPDDPYFDDKSQLTTVDLQLHEGNGVVASISTSLETSSKNGVTSREAKLVCRRFCESNGDMRTRRCTPRSVANNP